jgi:hypothetical protein
MSTALLLFESTHAVIKAERLLDEKKIPCKVIPVPKHISSECGLALEVSTEVRAEVVRALKLAGVHVTVSAVP